MSDNLSLTVKPVYVVQDHATGKMTFGISIHEAYELVTQINIILGWKKQDTRFIAYRCDNGIVHRKPYTSED